MAQPCRRRLIVHLLCLGKSLFVTPVGLEIGEEVGVLGTLSPQAALPSTLNLRKATYGLHKGLVGAGVRGGNFCVFSSERTGLGTGTSAGQGQFG